MPTQQSVPSPRKSSDGSGVLRRAPSGRSSPRPLREQRQPLMYRLQIFSLEVHVPPGHVQLRVTQDALKPKNIATVSQVGDSKRVSHRVKGTAHPRDGETL